MIAFVTDDNTALVLIVCVMATVTVFRFWHSGKTMTACRRCSKCKNTYPLDAEHFFPDNSKSPNEFRYWCKTCCIASDKDWSQTHREARRAINREYMRRKSAERREERENADRVATDGNPDRP